VNRVGPKLQRIEIQDGQLNFPAVPKGRPQHNSAAMAVFVNLCSCCISSGFLVTMFYSVHTVTIFLLTSVIGFVRLII